MMKIRLPVVMGIAALATLALAQVAVTIGANGQGAVLSPDRKAGTFNFEVSRRSEGNRPPVLRGRFRFEQRKNDFGPFALIEGGVPTTIGVTTAGNVCEFVGPGSYTRIVRDKRVTVRGTVSVRVEDRRNDARPNAEPDKFRVRFTGSETTFAFEGLVNSGYLTVFRR